MFKTIVTALAASSTASVVPAVIAHDYPKGSQSQRACAQLKATFPSNYVDATSGGNYTAKVDFNWSTNCDLPAACFFTPTSTDQVAKGLSIVTKNGAQFAIRNGGHNPNVGFSSTSDGVLFDMSGMNSYSISPDNTVIHAGSGHTGGSLQKIADSIGRSVVTGIDMAPGITGLTTLGGYTQFTQLHGLPTDNIVNFEIVLGNSSIVNANATHNTDLYRGLRGGGNNFGIVTRLDLRTSLVRNIWFALYLLDAKDYLKYMQAIGEVHAGIEKDPKANIEVLASPQAFQIALWYAEHTPTPEIFAPMLEFLPSAAEVIVAPTNGTLLEIMEAMSNETPPMVRMIDSVVHKPSVDMYIDLFEKILEQEPKGEDTNLVLAIKPMGTRVPSVGTERASGIPNSLNVQPIPQVWTSILSQYVNDVDKDEMTQKLHLMDEWLRDYAHNADLLLPYIFGNDAGAHQNVIQSYGEESVANMKAVSKRYDIAQVFQKLQAGGFLVSKA